MTSTPPKLRNTPEDDGTLLDHSLILYGSNMGDSNQHQHYDCPHILIGGASGQLKGGRHLEYPTRTISTGNLLLSVLDMYGIHLERIGTPERGGSTGRLTDLYSSQAWRAYVQTRTAALPNADAES